MVAAASSAFVVDASLSAAWFLPDEATDVTEAALQATASADVWVPAVWLLEIDNLLLSAQRRKRITADKRRELAAAAAALTLKIDREPVGMLVIDEIAARHGLSAYDATYLELSLRRRIRLATLDQKLRIAAEKEGLA